MTLLYPSGAFSGGGLYPFKRIKKGIIRRETNVALKSGLDFKCLCLKVKNVLENAMYKN
jgi:hypothetical protein